MPWTNFGLLDMKGKSHWREEYVSWPRSWLSPPTCKLNWVQPRRLRYLIPSSPLCLPQIQTFTALSCPFMLSEDCKNESEIIPLKGCWLGCGVCNLQLTDRLWNLIWVKVLICILLPDWVGGGASRCLIYVQQLWWIKKKSSSAALFCLNVLLATRHALAVNEFWAQAVISIGSSQLPANGWVVRPGK